MKPFFISVCYVKWFFLFDLNLLSFLQKPRTAQRAVCEQPGLSVQQCHLKFNRDDRI